MQPLGGAEIGAEEGAVAVQHAHQREARVIVALGEHLGAHQDVDLARAELVEHAGERALARGGVAIDARDARLRQRCAQRLLDALRALPHRRQIRPAARRARSRDALAVPAVVAAQLAGPRVQHQVRAAAAAGGVPGACAAEEHRREPAPVHEHQRLLAARQALAQGPHQRRGEPFLGAVGAGVDGAHRGHRGARDRALGRARRACSGRRAR